MAQLTTAILSLEAGAQATDLVAASAGGDTFTPSDTTFLEVKNGSESSITVTVATPGNVEGVDLAGFEFTVAASADVRVGPFRADLFAGTNGQASITYSAVTTVTIQPVQIGE